MRARVSAAAAPVDTMGSDRGVTYGSDVVLPRSLPTRPEPLMTWTRRIAAGCSFSASVGEQECQEGDRSWLRKGQPPVSPSLRREHVGEEAHPNARTFMTVLGAGAPSDRVLQSQRFDEPLR